jgi:hypothetical protein
MREYKFNFTIRLKKGNLISKDCYSYLCKINGLNLECGGENEKEAMIDVIFGIMNNKINAQSFNCDRHLTIENLFDEICESEEQI